MPSEDIDILKFNRHQKSDKAPFIIFEDQECLIETIEKCKDRPENSSSTKVTKHIALLFLMSTISSFKRKLGICRGKACRKKFCESLRSHNGDDYFLLKNKVINKRAAGNI